MLSFCAAPISASGSKYSYHGLVWAATTGLAPVALSPLAIHFGGVARPRNPTQETSGQKIWSFLNSQFFLTVFALVIIGGAVGLYNQWQEDLRDQSERRAVLGKLLTEYQHRVSELSAADSELNDQLGPSGTFDQMRRLDRSDRVAAARWDRLPDQVSAREWEILTGRGSYVPTAPEFAGVSFMNVASQVDNVAGIPDLQFGALRMVGLLETPPPTTFLFVRAQLPSLMQWGVRRHMLYMNQTIPLRRGARLTEIQERQLGIPQPRPGELERLQRENDLLTNRVQNKLRSAAER